MAVPLRKLLHECGPWPEGADPDAIAEQVEAAWKGARVFMVRPAVKRAWRKEEREPTGAAERLAHDIEAAILAGGGDGERVELCLLALMTDHVLV